MWKCVPIIILLMTWKNNLFQVLSDKHQGIFSETITQSQFSKVETYNTDNGYEVTEHDITKETEDLELLGNIYDVNVQAIYHSENRKVVLSVSWTHSIVLEYLESYTFKVTPIPTFQECEDISHQTTKKDITITSIYLPTPQHPFEVIPGCTYKINIIADFLHDRKISKEVDFTVPECVGKKCSCRNLKPVVTNFSAKEIKPGELKISWALQPHADTKINNILPPTFEYRPIVSERHHQNPFRLLTKSVLSNDTYYIFKANTQNGIHVGKEYQLRARFSNTYNCITSDYTNFTVSAAATSLSVNPTVEKDIKSYWLQITFAIVLILLVTLILVYILRRNRFIIKEFLLNLVGNQSSRRARQSDLGSQYYVMHNGNKKQQEVNLLYVEKEILEGSVDHYEFPRSRIVYIRDIGEGAFGRVYLAKAFGIQKQKGVAYVAVKTLPDRASPEQMDDLLTEIEILKKVGEHQHIVKLLGCCVLKEPYLMIMEYVPCGDLKNYLISLREKWQRRRTKSETTDSSTGSYIIPNSSRHRTLSAETEYTILDSDGFPTPTEAIINKVEGSLDHAELQKFALQIATGMEYLEKIGIAHRDLAARNILIDEFKTLKISDFGLSRIGPYINNSSKKMPLRWVAVEAIEDRFYDSKSDVWSFAVVLWEIGTLGAFPYGNVLDAMLPYYLFSGKRLSRPEICTDELYTLMLKCWAHNPQERPSFKELVEILDAKKRRIYVDFNQLNPLYVFPSIRFQKIENTTIVDQEHEIK